MQFMSSNGKQTNVKHVSESQPDFIFGFERKERPRNGIFGVFPSRKMGLEPKKEERVGSSMFVCRCPSSNKLQPSRSGKGEMFLMFLLHGEQTK